MIDPAQRRADDESPAGSRTTLADRFATAFGRFAAGRCAVEPSHSGYDRQRISGLLRATRRSHRSRRGGSLRSIAILAGIAAAGLGALWWQMGHGGLPLPFVTPGIEQAISEQVSGGHRVAIGETRLEIDSDGRPMVVLMHVSVRDAEGTLVAVAPRAAVSLDRSALAFGQIQPRGVDLVGAEMAVRIEDDGRIAVTAGGAARPIAEAPPVLARPPSGPAPGAGDAPAPTPAEARPPVEELLARIVSWLDALEATGFDGAGLRSIGIKSGAVVIDDARGGKQFVFQPIDLSLSRPPEGGINLRLVSGGTDGPWAVNGRVERDPDGRRRVVVDVRDVSPKDITLAAGVAEPDWVSDMPVSAHLEADITPAGRVERFALRVAAGAGFLEPRLDPKGRMLIDEASIDVAWDPASRLFRVGPVAVLAGRNRAEASGIVQPPASPGGDWRFEITGGRATLGAIRPDVPPLAIDRVVGAGRYDAAGRRLVLDRLDVVGPSAGLAISAQVDFTHEEPIVTAGMSSTPMTILELKRIWPAFIVPDIRNWVIERVSAGEIRSSRLAIKVPIRYLRPAAVPPPDDAVLVEATLAGVSFAALDGPPPVRDADVVIRSTGQTVAIRMARGTVELRSGRRIALPEGLFEVPDVRPQPTPARVRLSAEGGIDAILELAALPPFRDAARGLPEPGAIRGNVSAQVQTSFRIEPQGPPSDVATTIDADLTQVVMERVARNYRLDASALKLNVAPSGVGLRGDVRIGGVPAALDVRRGRGEAPVEFRLSGTLDDAARTRLGLDTGPGIAGPIGFRLSGRLGEAERDQRYGVELDLTAARINDPVPGWSKPAGRPTRASFVASERQGTTRLDDLVVEGQGVSIRGQIEFDDGGQVVGANLPVFHLSDGDKASVRIDRTQDSALRIVVRGDVVDGRGLVKSLLAAPPVDPRNRPRPIDADLDVRVGAVAGHTGEVVRQLELKLSRRAGQIRSFGLSGRIGRDGELLGEIRNWNNRRYLYVASGDAGAAMRFIDFYTRAYGGSMWLAIEPPTAEGTPQDGVLSVRDFVIRGEPALEGIVASGPMVEADPAGRTTGGQQQRPRLAFASSAGVEFNQMRVQFLRQPARLIIRDGVVSGPSIGATFEGNIDYVRDQIAIRGTIVPAYALNNLFAQLPLLGLFLGGGNPNEGLLGITYELAGSANQPTFRVNPVSAVAPGFLRRFFDFRNAAGQAPTPEPTR